MVKRDVDFYGASTAACVDRSLNIRLTPPYKKKAVLDFFNVAANSRAMETIAHLRAVRDVLALNDWGYFQLVDHLSESLYQQRMAERNLFNWFVLIKSGFDARIGYNDRNLYLLLPVKEQIYGAAFMKLSGQNFYVFNGNNSQQSVGSMYTYDKDYPGKTRLLSMRMKQYPLIPEKLKTRSLQLTSDKKLNVRYNLNSIRYWGQMPQVDYSVYATTPKSGLLNEDLYEPLRRHLANKNEDEAIKILLHFTQKAFSYKTDGDQFGREKPMVPEETVHYPYSDCEDRSYFFTQLVRELLGLEVVLLKYPNHLATAVKISNPQGDTLMIAGKRFTICDPTYIGADPGMAMPQFKQVKPEVVRLDI
ncbi:MAG: hypothetical protein C0615_01290 [Desulfuromonas sp.]|nr:MAG: hypothetical protein C0615_01290 [Desulfuromonas sp.]